MAMAGETKRGSTGAYIVSVKSGEVSVALTLHSGQGLSGAV